MPDQKITVTDEMVAAALNAANEYGRDGGWLTSAGLCRSAITAALTAAPAVNPAHNIDWQEVAERHEDTIKGLVAGLDEARESLREANETAKSLRTMTARDHLNAAREAGHPLPKGATIPEGAAFWVRSPGEPWEFVSPGPDEDFDTSPFPNSQYVLLDPKRPGKAEMLARVEAYVREVGDGAVDALDDFLASRGARVVSEDGA